MLAVLEQLAGAVATADEMFWRCFQRKLSKDLALLVKAPAVPQIALPKGPEGAQALR